MLRILIAAALIATALPAHAGNWQGPHNPWYEKQMPTPETRSVYGIGWESCCNHGDVCQDCVVHRVSDKPPWRDGWYYTKDGVTRPLPPHIVEYVPYTPTGKPVLFIAPFAAGNMHKDDPVCLKVPGGQT